MQQKVNLPDAVNSGKLYEYKEVGKINGQMLNVVKVADRTLDFHVHENSDEAFYVIEGEFALEFDDGLVQLKDGDLLIVPRGVRHRPICKSLVKILLIDMSGALNNENSGGTYNN
jgi:mannose-6-phosphate isomerase-like protein (cupin superfamily)